MSDISWALIEIIFNNRKFDSFESLIDYHRIKRGIDSGDLVMFKNIFDFIIKNRVSYNLLKWLKDNKEFMDKFDIIVENKVSLDWLKEFKDKGLMEFKDYIDVIIKLGLKFDKLVKYKGKYDNKIDVFMNCLYKQYNTSDENRKLIEGLDYEGKKQVIDNLVKSMKEIDKRKLNDNIYNDDLFFF